MVVNHPLRRWTLIGMAAWHRFTLVEHPINRNMEFPSKPTCRSEKSIVRVQHIHPFLIHTNIMRISFLCGNRLETELVSLVRKGCCTMFHPTYPKSLTLSHQPVQTLDETIMWCRSGWLTSFVGHLSLHQTSNKQKNRGQTFTLEISGQKKKTPMWAMKKNNNPYFALNEILVV